MHTNFSTQCVIYAYHKLAEGCHITIITLIKRTYLLYTLNLIYMNRAKQI